MTKTTMKIEHIGWVDESGYVWDSKDRAERYFERMTTPQQLLPTFTVELEEGDEYVLPSV